MSTETNDWIKMSERKPAFNDFPIWAFYAHENIVTWTNSMSDLNVDGNSTHWKPAQLPAPPPKEPTQREEDGEARRKWY